MLIGTIPNRPKLWSNEWFQVWQPLLLIAVNSPFGLGRDVRQRLGINLDMQIPINRLMRNSFRIKVGFNEYQETFYGKPVFAIALKREWAWLWNLIHKWDMNFANHVYPKMNLGFDTLTVYPTPAPSNSSIDGYIEHGSPYSTSWDRTATDGTSNSRSTIYIASRIIYYPDDENYTYVLSRGIIHYDTSTLTSLATITDGVISINNNSKSEIDSSQMDIYIVSSTVDLDTALSNSHYNISLYGSANFASITYENIASGYNDFTLSAGGISNISKTSVSRFGIRCGGDFNNAPLTSNPSGSQNNSMYFYSSYDTNDPIRDPRLTVTYTLPSSVVNAVII